MVYSLIDKNGIEIMVFKTLLTRLAHFICLFNICNSAVNQNKTVVITAWRGFLSITDVLMNKHLVNHKTYCNLHGYDYLVFVDEFAVFIVFYDL